MSSVTDKDSVGPKRKRGLKSILFIFRTGFWFAVLLVVWSMLSSILPWLPGPVQAGKSIFFAGKSVTDEVYYAVHEESLQKAAEMVREEADHEEADHVVVEEEEKSLPETNITPERRAKLPAVPIREDSALRSRLTQISKTPKIGGRVIHILVIGIDSRLGARNARADALHLVTVNPDSAVVEIMSIPRDTYVDLGFHDTTTYNIIANARSLGKRGLMRRVGKLTRRRNIKYYVEVGFSQAMGVLEILGYKDPVKTLKFLRTRKGLPGGDVQRSHNQAIFIRQNLISKFPLLTGGTGDLILSGGLRFVSTNLTKEFCLGMVYALQSKGFPDHRKDAVRLRMLPRYRYRLKEMAPDSLTIAATLERADRSMKNTNSKDVNVEQVLRRANRKAIQDSARPRRVVSRLARLFEQKAWMQVHDKSVRSGLRDTLSSCLEKAYRQLDKTELADHLLEDRHAEDSLLRVSSGTIDSAGTKNILPSVIDGESNGN